MSNEHSEPNERPHVAGPKDERWDTEASIASAPATEEPEHDDDEGFSVYVELLDGDGREVDHGWVAQGCTRSEAKAELDRVTRGESRGPDEQTPRTDVSEVSRLRAALRDLREFAVDACRDLKWNASEQPEILEADELLGNSDRALSRICPKCCRAAIEAGLARAGELCPVCSDPEFGPWAPAG